MPENPIQVKPMESYKSEVPVTWCPGCGDFSVLHAVYKALGILGYDTKDTVICSGIGCSGRLPIFTTCYGFHGVHGRVLPTAMGVKLANPKLHVFAVGGDGDGLAIGGGHFSHAARRNLDITYIMLDNSTYGLTKGQYSPTTSKTSNIRSIPYGATDDSINPIGLALAYNASFVARGFSGQLNQLIDLIVRAAKHPGFSFLHVISPCVVFNNTYPYYMKNVTKIPDNHDIKNKRDALNLWQDPDKTYIGVFHDTEDRDALSARYEKMKEMAQTNGKGNLEKLLDNYR
ncbi:MAG: thiamine pyrophosphate-dependent enzyme [Elusimicrobiota bacterium]